MSKDRKRAEFRAARRQNNLQKMETVHRAAVTPKSMNNSITSSVLDFQVSEKDASND